MEKRNIVDTSNFPNGPAEDHLRVVIESVSDYAIFTLNAHRHVLTWNKGAEALTGYSEHEIIGKSADIIFTPEDRDKKAPETEAKKAEKEGRAENEGWHVRKDGSLFWGSGSVSPLRGNNGTLLGFVKIMRDLTEKKEAEERYHARMEREVSERTAELRKAEQETRVSRELLAATINSSMEMIQVFEAVRDEKGEIVDFKWKLYNHAAGKIYGDVIGESLLEHNPGVVDTGIFNAFKEVTTSGIPQQYEKHYVHEQFDGWFYQSVVKLGDGVTNTTTNITERKKASEQLLQLQEELAQKATDKYLTLFNSIDEGFYLAEVIYDEKNRPVDIHYHEENPAAVRILGASLKGKKLTEISSDPESYWLDIYVSVALTGESKRLEKYSKDFNKWFNLYVSRSGDENSRQIAIVFQDITDLKQTRDRLEEGKDLLQSVFDVSYNGLSVLRSVRNEAGELIDMEYVYANQATKRTNNRYDLEGKLYSEVHAGFSGTDYHEVVKHVVETGEPHQYQLRYNFEHLDNWFNITTFKLNDGVVISFEDISEIKRAEFILRESEERKAFLLQLSDALRPLSKSVEIQEAATRTAMNFFGADRCYYCEIENDTAIIRRDASKEDLPSVAASYPLRSMPIFKSVLDAGHPLVVQDSNTTNLMDENLRQLCIQMQILSYVNVPVIKHGLPAGTLCLTQCATRNWTANEVELMVEVAEQVWAAIERAKAEEAVAADLRDTQILQKLSEHLVSEDNIDVIYQQVIDTAITLTNADAGTVQIFDNETQELALLSTKGFEKNVTDHFARVNAASNTSCGLAMANKQRTFVDFDVPGAEDRDGSLRMHFEAGILSAQSTPLISRSGKPIGMVSTHWRQHYRPTERELRFLDLLARQAADLIEQRQAQKALEQNQARLAIELANTQQLQYISTTLIQEDNSELLYDQILDAAITIMQSDMGSLQMLFPEKNELLLLAWKGFDPRSAKFWKWVKFSSASTCGIALKSGERVIVADVDACAFMEGTEDLDSYRLSGIKAVQTTPLVSRTGKTVGMISSHWCNVYHPANHELSLLDVLARQAADLIERRRSEEAVRKSEEKYRSLFNSINQGFGIAEMLFDEQDRLIDYRWLEVNAQFENLLGMSMAPFLGGKTVRQVYPEQFEKRGWREVFAKVALSGEPKRFEEYSPYVDRWFDMYVFRTGIPDERKIAILFNDITKRKRHEANTQFLAEVIEEFSYPSSPVEIIRRVGEKIGAYMHVDNCSFVDVDESAEKEMIPIYNWFSSGERSYPEAFRIREYLTEEFEISSRAGETIVVCDTNTDSRTDAQGYNALKVNSFIVVPFFRTGEWKYFLACSNEQPREWRQDEIEFFESLASHIFPRLEKARAEEALRESEERMRTLIENLPGGAAFVVNRDLRYLLAGGEALTELGLKPGDFIGKTVDEAVNAEQAERYKLHYFKAINGETFSLEHDVSNRSFLTRGVPLASEDGEIYAALAVSYDITSRKLAEKALRESEERLRTLADSVPQVIWSNDAGGKANFFNQRWYQYSGLSFEESFGVGWEAIVHPDDAPASIEKWQQALAEGKIFDAEYRLRNAAGKYCWFIGRNVPLKDDSGKIIGWFGSATDIHDLKNAQEEVRNTSERLQLALEAGNLGTYEYDFNKGIYAASVQHKANFGYTENDQVSLESFMDRVLPKDRAYMETMCHKELEKHAVYSTEYRIQLPIGDICWIRSVGRFVYNEKGEPEKMVGITLDITDEKMFTEELTKQVKERTRELQQSNNDLQQFAHVASHDLKEPVRKIKTFNNRIIDDYAEMLPAKVQTYLQKIDHSTDRMFAMIEGVLNYSKLGATQQSMQALDLNKILRNIEMDLEVLIQKKNATITITELPTITGNETLMYQLFYNLALNSLKFAKADEPAHIDIRCAFEKQEQKRFAKITFSDNGIGFEQEYAHTIFDTFTRLNPADEYEGTGLGLALCKKIVERHNGSISATAELGKGATFTILLPLPTGSPSA